MTIKNQIFNLIKNNKINQIIKLIEKNKKFNVNIFNDNNISLLEFAVNYNNFDLFKLLIDRKVNIDIYDLDGRTILYQIIKQNRIKFLKNLLDYNENRIGMNLLEIKDINNNFGIHYCIIFNNLEINYNKKVLDIYTFNSEHFDI